MNEENKFNQEADFDYKAEFQKTGNRKYVLDMNKAKNVDGHTFYRIIYKDGSKGGWIESYDNLSQYGDSKVLDEAEVYGKAKVYDEAKITGNAELSGNALVDYDVSEGNITE